MLVIDFFLWCSGVKTKEASSRDINGGAYFERNNKDANDKIRNKERNVTPDFSGKGEI